MKRELMAHLQAVLDEAHNAARLAVAGLADRGDKPCGFAWVVVNGRSPLARYCRAKAKGPFTLADVQHHRQYGSKNYPTGWMFWCPGGYAGQDMATLVKAANAFAESLSENGYSATVCSRLD